MTVDCLALTSGSVPKSMSVLCAKMPTQVTTTAHRRPTTTIFKCVRRSLVCIEWFMMLSALAESGETAKSERSNTRGRGLGLS